MTDEALEAKCVSVLAATSGLILAPSEKSAVIRALHTMHAAGKAEGVAEERERAARIAERYAETARDTVLGPLGGYWSLATAIRSGSDG